VSWSGAAGPYSASFAKTGLSRVEYFAMVRGLYDETMAHQDHQLGRLVERLKAAGEWEHTILIVASDHGLSAGAKDFHLGMLEPLPAWWGPMFRPSVTRIPLIVVWPERIAAGQRFSQPVSMIDALPTVLDLAGLPMPEVMQGQSLGPLLLGQDGWEPRPVILEEFYLDKETGELGGVIEVVDGRWGAALRIGPMVWTGVPGWSVDAQIDRPTALLLYDLWNDPECLVPLNDERPDLVEKYTDFLKTRWSAHQALARRFTLDSDVALTGQQLETLRALGYIQ